jgi:hypothetical protein
MVEAGAHRVTSADVRVIRDVTGQVAAMRQPLAHI